MINVGIIGASGHYLSAIEAQESGEDIKVISFCAVFPDEDLSFLRQHCADAVEAADYKSLLADPKLDAVVVCTHFDWNNQIVCKALQAGLACYCEKPAFLNATEEERLANVLKNCPPNYYANMYEMRMMPHFMATKEYVRTGALGQILLVHSQKSYKCGVRPDFYHARATYGGTIPWVGCHAFDLVQWICGAALEPVYACHSTAGGGPDSELERSALCVCKFPGGSASFSLDFLRPSQADTHGDDRLRIVGTTGILEIRSGQVMVIDAEGSRTLPLPAPENPFVHFVRKLRDPHAVTLLPDAAECLQTAHLALTLRELADAERHSN